MKHLGNSNRIKLLKIFVSRTATVLLLSAAVLCVPHKSSCDSVPVKELQAVLLQGAFAATTYNAASNGGIVIDTKEIMAMRETKDTGKTPLSANLSSAVNEALSRMKIRPDAIDKWISKYPHTTLKYLPHMPLHKQREVANVAMFIRSINNRVMPSEAWREASALVFYSNCYGLPVGLTVGVANTESRFNPGAVSRRGAVGVMQVMWKVHRGMLSAKGIATEKAHMFDPERGIEAGVLILSRYVNRYGTIQKALKRYCGGVSSSYLKKVNKNIALLEKHSQKTGL